RSVLAETDWCRPGSTLIAFAAGSFGACVRDMHVIGGLLSGIRTRVRSTGRVLQPVVCGAITTAMLAGCGPSEVEDVTEDVPAAEVPERWESGADLDAARSGDRRAEA